MVNDELKKFLHLFATLGGVLIILNAVIVLVMASFAARVTVGVVTIDALPAFSAVALVAIFAVVGIVLGMIVILESNEAIRVSNSRDHWVRLIIFGVVSFVVASGFVLGAVLVFLSGFGGFLLESGLNPFNLLHFGAKTCPNCGHMSSTDARYCSSCGTSFSK